MYYSVYGHLLSKERLYKGFKKVWKAKGAAGIDMQSLSDFASNLSDNLDQLLLELRDVVEYYMSPDVTNMSGFMSMIKIVSGKCKVSVKKVVDIFKNLKDVIKAVHCLR